PPLENVEKKAERRTYIISNKFLQYEFWAPPVWKTATVDEKTEFDDQRTALVDRIDISHRTFGGVLYGVFLDTTKRTTDFKEQQAFDQALIDLGSKLNDQYWGYHAIESFFRSVFCRNSEDAEDDHEHLSSLAEEYDLTLTEVKR
ncbi:MAG: hypothetical protein Q9226_003058, partial [Calogaya cf. arnoldii]